MYTNLKNTNTLITLIEELAYHTDVTIKNAEPLIHWKEF